MREDVVVKTNDIIQKTLILVILLSIAAMSIAMFVSIRIDKIIKEYTDKIIAYEDNKRKQEALFLEQSKLASMGEMISNIAHQWRQPLATISMGANNIIADVDLDIVENQTLRKNAKEITEQTIYLSKTIDDFRNFIKGNKEKKGFNLSENIKNFMNLVQGSVKNNNINIILELQDDIELIGHENELIQCLINIFHNAKDAFIEKGVAQRFLFISTFLEDNNVIIKIKDNAGGIPEEILPKIFEPYFTTKFKSQGTGLGLHMTYSLIVNGMAGRIEVQNVDYEYDGQNYQGAQFAIILPTS
jgi:C4-dicarboxylate-specific signal transduction histidine kinase